MISVKRLIFCLAASPLAMAANVTQAHAQDAMVDNSNAASDTDTQVASGEIIVTAQRTSSLASKTPVSLSAIDGDTLRSQGVTNPADLGAEVPNLSIVRNNGLQITIRGVSSSDNTEKGDPSAAFLLDGVYIARPQAQEVSFFDVSRVEVLRGPQGTLYGRNTTAGLINVITNKPADHFEAAANLSYGNYNTVQANAMVNLPVNDIVALRFAGSWDRRDNYISPQAGDTHNVDPFKDNRSGRAQVKFDFSPDLEVLIRADYSAIRGTGFTDISASRYYAPLAAGAPAYTSPNYIGGQFSSRELRDVGYGLVNSPVARNSTWGVDGEVNWDFGPLGLNYLGSYREFRTDITSSALVGIPIATTRGGFYKQVSQELRFHTSSSSRLNLQFGGYYFREDSNNSLYLLNLIAGFPYYGFLQGPTKSETLGAFAQASYPIVEGLRLTAGARYSRDNKSRQGAINFQKGPVLNLTTDRSSPNNATIKSDKITWRLGLDYDLDSRSLLYAVVSTGYKAGGFNGGCAAGTPNCLNPQDPLALYYQPETLTSYEIGLKTRTFDNKLRLTADAFHYDYSNLQVSSVADIGGAPRQVTTNAARAKVDGAEIEATLTPSLRNRLNLSFTYLDARYASYFPLGVGNAPDFAGRQLDHAPKYVASVGYTYTVPLANGGEIQAGVRSRLSSSYVMTVQSRGQQYRQPSYTRTDLSLTYNAPDDRFYIQGFWQNLEDNINVTSISFSGGRALVTPSDPMTYGVRGGFKF